MWMVGLWLSGCTEKGETYTEFVYTYTEFVSSDADTDTDTDSDTDSDTDADSDADSDTDTDTSAPVTTPCPPTEGLSCDRGTQVCVVAGPFGPTDTSSCESVPEGCEDDRSCACVSSLCPSPTDVCSERADNTIYCDNGSQ